MNASPQNEATITHLWRWPVKGLGGQPLQNVDVEAGQLFPFDRAFAIENGPSGFDSANPEHVKKRHFVCMVHQPDTARLSATYDETSGTLSITTLDGRSHTIDPNQPQPLETLTEELVKKGIKGPLKLRKADDLASGHGFTDVPERWISIQNQASLDALSDAVGQSVDPRRVRTNVLATGWDAFAEESLVGQTLSIGTARVRVESVINRCRAIDVNPDTADLDRQLVRALMGMNGNPSLGLYATIIEGGTITLGDEISLNEQSNPV